LVSLRAASRARLPGIRGEVIDGDVADYHHNGGRARPGHWLVQRRRLGSYYLLRLGWPGIRVLDLRQFAGWCQRYQLMAPVCWRGPARSCPGSSTLANRRRGACCTLGLFPPAAAAQSGLGYWRWPRRM